MINEAISIEKLNGLDEHSMISNKQMTNVILFQNLINDLTRNTGKYGQEECAGNETEREKGKTGMNEGLDGNSSYEEGEEEDGAWK